MSVGTKELELARLRCSTQAQTPRPRTEGRICVRVLRSTDAFSGLVALSVGANRQCLIRKNLSCTWQTSDTATLTINLLNQAGITGAVFVDVNGNGLYDANEPGIDGVTVRLLDTVGAPFVDAYGDNRRSSTVLIHVSHSIQMILIWTRSGARMF